MTELLRTLRSWIQLPLALVLVIIMVVKFGFAWALIAAVVGWWVWARRFDAGEHGQNAMFVPIVGIVLAIALAIGLTLRLVIP